MGPYERRFAAATPVCHREGSCAARASGAQPALNGTLTTAERQAYASPVAHPRMFDEDDPILARVREIASSFPGAGEKVSHGRPAFFTKKVFAYYGGSLKVDGRWVEHPHSVIVQPDAGDRPALVEDPRVYVPAYLGPSGWLGVDLDAGTDWVEVGELLDASYRLTAPRRSIAELDARS